LWLNRRPDEERGSRFHVGAAVVNLTGSGEASRNMFWPGTKLTTHLGVVERNLEREPAADLVAGIEAGRWSRCLLPWVPLLAGADDPALIDQWKRLAEMEPDSRRRAEFAGIAHLFAEKVGRKEIWQEKLKGWNVEESSVVREWMAIGEARGVAANATASILRLGAKQFGAASPETEAAIRAIADPARLERMFGRLVDALATDWADLLATA
jgi:hypothetical protein